MTSADSADPYDGRMSDRAPTHYGDRARLPGVAAAFVIDALLVVVFAYAGRASHAEALDAAGVWQTAWPFLAGLVIGWLVTGAWRHPMTPWPTGALIWGTVLIVGMLLRVATGQGVALAFVIVAAVTLVVSLVGWRAIVTGVGRSRRRRTAETAASAEARAR
jgi:uncharacterized membrane protein